jgi:hypothetical protein
VQGLERVPAQEPGEQEQGQGPAREREQVLVLARRLRWLQVQAQVSSSSFTSSGCWKAGLPQVFLVEQRRHLSASGLLYVVLNDVDESPRKLFGGVRLNRSIDRQLHS